MRVRALVTLAVVAAGTLLVPAPAQAAARVSVSNDQGTAKVDPTYATSLTVSGQGFQSIRGGSGGIYVFFGTVSGAWQPTKGGQVGTDYRYVPDSESKDNQGYQRFVAYPGSDTAGAANGGTIAADGRWSTSLTVPGTTFKTVDRAGKTIEVDCRKVTCGVITIGAHGVKNAQNETFTPVSFESLGASREPAASEADAPAAGAAAPSAGAPTAAAAPPAAAPATAADAKAVIDPSTAVVGRVLSFTGSGFTPGEQVIATLDDGMAAVGPLGAGPSGEVAGVLQLPEGTKAGTHVLKLTGAASGATPVVNFPIAADPAAVSATTEDDGGGLPGWMPFAFLALAAVALLGAVTFAALRIRKIRRNRTPSEPDAVSAPQNSGDVVHAL